MTIEQIQQLDQAGLYAALKELMSEGGNIQVSAGQIVTIFSVKSQHAAALGLDQAIMRLLIGAKYRAEVKLMDRNPTAWRSWVAANNVPDSLLKLTFCL